MMLPMYKNKATASRFEGGLNAPLSEGKMLAARCWAGLLLGIEHYIV